MFGPRKLHLPRLLYNSIQLQQVKSSGGASFAIVTDLFDQVCTNAKVPRKHLKQENREMQHMDAASASKREETGNSATDRNICSIGGKSITLLE